MPKHIYGKQLNALLNPPLQRLTAWGAATLLRGKLDGMMIDLPSVRLDVQEWCSGLVTMKWLTLLAIVIVLIPRGDWRWKVALVLVAPLIGLEANILRVAGIGGGIEWFGYESRHWIKEWTGWGAMALGVVQVVGLGWLINWQRVRTA